MFGLLLCRPKRNETIQFSSTIRWKTIWYYSIAFINKSVFVTMAVFHDRQILDTIKNYIRECGKEVVKRIFSQETVLRIRARNLDLNTKWGRYSHLTINSWTWTNYWELHRMLDSLYACSWGDPQESKTILRNHWSSKWSLVYLIYSLQYIVLGCSLQAHLHR